MQWTSPAKTFFRALKISIWLQVKWLSTLDVTQDNVNLIMMNLFHVTIRRPSSAKLSLFFISQASFLCHSSSSYHQKFILSSETWQQCTTFSSFLLALLKTETRKTVKSISSLRFSSWISSFNEFIIPWRPEKSASLKQSQKKCCFFHTRPVSHMEKQLSNCAQLKGH